MMETILRYTGIEANKFKEASGPVNINNNSSITDVEKTKEGLLVGFLFTSAYEPGVGEIKLKGKILVRDAEEKLDEAMKTWSESGEKSLPKDMIERVHNLILFNCMTESVIVARDLQLPSPLPLPRITVADKKDTSYIG